jgi:proteic killer suppression protein
MIKSFKCKDTEKLFNDLDVRKFRSISRTARIKLEVLHAVVSLNSLRIPPGNRLEQLKGNRNDQYSKMISTVSELTISGASASCGMKDTHTMLKS